MNPTAIYSKSGKGVQEASGKTGILDRGDRAVLSAIDGRATLADVAKKCGKTFDSAFQTLISKLDKDGFIREASPGTASAAKPGAAPAAKAPGGKAADTGGAGDLDFSMLGASKTASPAPSRPAAPPPKPAAPPPPPPPPKPNPAAEAQAKAQQSALQKAREEAEAKADAERQRIKAEAEAKMRTEMEAKAREEASQKLKLEAERKAKEEADARIKAAQEAAARVAAEAKAKADAEAKARVEAERKAREEAERARKAAEEEARRAREEAERARKAAEEEARKAREEAERIRKAAEEEARKAREEAERVRKAAEEEARKVREEAERAARRKAREEEERQAEEERAAKRRQREEDEQRVAEEAAAAKAKKKDKAEEPAPAKSEAAGGLDSLLADLDSFTTREEEERKEKDEVERKAKEIAAQRAREEEQRRALEDIERMQKEEARARKEEEKRRKREEEEALRQKREADEKRLREEEEKRKKEADERARKAKQEEVLAAQANRAKVSIGEDTDEVRKRMMGKRGGPASVVEPPSLRRKKSGWGKPVAITLVILLAAAVGAVHVMPVSTAEYERAASEAFGQPVRIGEAHLSLLGGGLQLKLKDIRLGDDVRIASGAASPELDSLRSERKVFSRIELDGMKVPQEAIGQSLLAKVKADNFSVARIVVRGLELTGPAVLPRPLEADLVYGEDGSLRSATVRGPDTFLARITPGTNNIEYVVTASGLPLPVLPELTLSDFGMKGTANQRGMSIAEWGGKVYGGSISGTANVRWGGGWSIDGVITARNINAAVFAPALLSEGRGEGTGRFSMNGSEPTKLASGSRLEGNFTVSSGVLGSFDLGRVIRTSGREYAGRTQFNELSGQATYDRGTVSLRNVAIGAGALNAGASADIGQGGALTGRIIADVKSSSGGRSASATLHLGGTIKEPQVRN